MCMCLWDTPLPSQSLRKVLLPARLLRITPSCPQHLGVCRVKGTCSEILPLPHSPCLGFPLIGSSGPAVPQTPHSGEQSPLRNLQRNPTHMHSREQGSFHG